jgi:hypothetical protein
MLFISAGSHVSGYTQFIDDRGKIRADLTANRINQVILNNIEVQIGGTRMVIGLLQTVRIERDGETSGRSDSEAERIATGIENRPLTSALQRTRTAN